MTLTRRAIMAGGAALTAELLPFRATASLSTATLSFGPATGIYSLGMIAEAKGFFKSEGLDCRLLITNAGSQGRQSLAAGQVLFAHGDASHPLQLSARGKKSKIVLATQMIASYANIVLRKDLYDRGITTVEALAEYKRPDGTRPIIAATAIGAGTWMYGTYVFESKKLGDRVNWVAGGSANTILPSLETKQFDAIMAMPTWVLEAETRGIGKVIYDTSKPGVFEEAFGGTVPVLVIYTLEETIQQNTGMVQAFVNGLVQGMKWIKEAPYDAILELVGNKYFSGVDPVALKTEIEFDKSTWAYDGRITKASWERGGKIWYRKATDIPESKFEDIVDMRFLDNALAKFK